MLVWDLIAAAIMAVAVTVALAVILGWRRDDWQHCLTSGILIFSLVFCGAWALGVWLSASDGGHPTSGFFWATYAVSAVIAGLAVAAVLPQRILHQLPDKHHSVRVAKTGDQIGGILYCLVMTGLVVLIVRHYVM